jgi:hypothetical protein
VAAEGSDRDWCVREVRDWLDQVEAQLQLGQHVGFDVADALEAVARLRGLLDLSADPAVVAAAALTARSIDLGLARIRLPDPPSRGGAAAAARAMQRDLKLWQLARRECPDALARSDRAAALWLCDHREQITTSDDRLRKLLVKGPEAVRKALGKLAKR